MEYFTIISRLTTKEYIKVLFIGLYRRPMFILATCLAIYLITTVILDYLHVIEYYDETPLYEIICGLFILLGPALFILYAGTQLSSSKSLTKDTSFTFGESGISIKGNTYSCELSWNHIIKQKTIGRFLILYHSKNLGNFIDTSKLTAEQLAYIKSKITIK